MGQRLVITVMKNGEDIAKIYYHWSAYSISALAEAKDVINCLTDEDNQIEDVRLRLIRFVESNGGCIDGGKGSHEYVAISEMYPDAVFREDGSRNNGLIALTTQGMAEMQSWSEGDIEIDLDNEMVYNHVYWADTIETYTDWMDDAEVDIDNIPVLDVNISDIRFTDVDDIINILENEVGYIFRKGNLIYQLIA